MTFPAQAPKLTGRGDGPAPFTTLKLNTGSGEFRAMSGMLINLIIQIISGAVGGNVAGGAAKNIDLGTLETPSQVPSAAAPGDRSSAC